jgi:hypothetical protein
VPGARLVLLLAAASLAIAALLAPQAGAGESSLEAPRLGSLAGKRSAATAAAGIRARATRPARRAKRAHRRRARVRKSARRRGSWGHVPAWLKAADPFATGDPSAPQPPGATPPGPAPPDPGTPQPPAPPPPSCGTAAGARMGEWYLKPSRTTLCVGQVTIEAQNYGQDPHDMRLQRENGPELASWPELAPGSPGGVLARKVTLTAGRYTLYCSLTGGTPPGTPGESHAAAGMTATLTVVAP